MTADDDRSTIHFRRPRREDGLALWALARSNGLDENSPYAYLLWAEYFATTTVVATTDDDHDTPIGFVTAFARPDEPRTVFVWQVGVDDAHRRRGIAGAVLDHLVDWHGADHLEATVTPSNTASETLFRRFGERRGTEVTTEELFSEGLFPPGHEAEIRFRIGPFTPSAPAAS
ncbi:MAG: diaminobutyrate acetyltransferase [Acidimicrobiales bacterium]|nr:diaminobutyrate acetyltransferase [Acidimicrobiales bacterium]